MADEPFPSLWSRIRDDRSRGSRELLIWTLNQLVDFVEDDAKLTESNCYDLCRNLALVRPEMAVFRSAAALLYRNLTLESSDPIAALYGALEDLKHHLKESSSRLRQAASDELKRTTHPLLFSRSGTVLDLFKSTEGI
ncbi:MAG: hypothetical protein ABEK50_16045 [bacterium]